MRKVLAFVSFLYLASVGMCQQISGVNFDYIKEKTTDSVSQLYYPVLEKRMLELDTTLDMDEYEFLYYGHVFTDKYHPYSGHDLMDSMRNDMNKKRYREALVPGWQIYNDNPVSIDINYRMMACYHRLEIKDSARIFARNYYRFLEVIYRSGDGKGAKTAYVVACVNDEYHILSDMGLALERQSLIDGAEGPCDRMDVKPEGKETPAEFRKIKSVFFNVSMPFETMSRMFEH